MSAKNVLASKSVRQEINTFLLPALQQLPEGLAIFDESNCLVLCNETFQTYYPKLADLLMAGTHVSEIIQAVNDRKQVVSTETPIQAPYSWPSYSKHGPTVEHLTSEGRWIKSRYRTTRENGWLISSRDISEFNAIQQALATSQDNFSASIINNPFGIAIIDKKSEQVVFSNSAAQIIMLGTADPDINGRPLDLHLEVNATIEASIFPAGELDARTIEYSVTETKWQQRSSYLVILHDITVRKQGEQQVEYFAYHDPLTGLPNRRLLYDRLQQALARAQRDRLLIAVLFLDLDRFKSINDKFGHAAGDQLLRLAATRLRECLRDMDTVARLGGDEFIVLLEQVGDPEAVRELAERIRTALSQPFILAEQKIPLSVSIGISLYPQNSNNPDQLIKLADTAMYQAKELGKNRVRFYQD